jgi:hypothetical protein
LISHFPCSLDCEASKLIAIKRLAFLQKECPDIAALFEQRLRSFVIYTEEEGIFFADDYSIDGNQITFASLYGTVENNLFNKLKKAGKVKIISYNCILIDCEKLEGNIGVMLFV